MKHLLLGTALLLSSSSIALANEVWTGTGELYDAQRRLESTYTIKVESEATSDTTERLTIEVEAGGEVVYSDVCELSKAENMWQKKCRDSEGGGYLFAYGLSQEYVALKSGGAHVTTMIKDSDTKIRILRTELDAASRATRFFSETLEKAAK